MGILIDTTDLISQCNYVFVENDTITYVLEVISMNNITYFPIIGPHGKYLCTCCVFYFIQYSTNYKSLKINNNNNIYNNNIYNESDSYMGKLQKYTIESMS